MTALSDRKKLILAAVVEHYIKTGEPIGSKELIANTGLNVSSATILGLINTAIVIPIEKTISEYLKAKANPFFFVM